MGHGSRLVLSNDHSPRVACSLAQHGGGSKSPRIFESRDFEKATPRAGNVLHIRSFSNSILRNGWNKSREESRGRSYKCNERCGGEVIFANEHERNPFDFVGCVFFSDVLFLFFVCRIPSHSVSALSKGGIEFLAFSSENAIYIPRRWSFHYSKAIFGQITFKFGTNEQTNKLKHRRVHTKDINNRFCGVNIGKCVKNINLTFERSQLDDFCSQNELMKKRHSSHLLCKYV